MVSDRRPQKAFTLVELLVVIAIIGILIALLFPGGALITDDRYEANANGAVPVGTHKILIEAFRLDPKYADYAKSLPPDSPERDILPEQQYIPAKYNTKTELQITIEPGSRPIARNFDLTD